MKTFRTIPALLVTLVLCMGLLFSATSCAVVVKRDNGIQRGHHRNPNNPHHNYSASPKRDKGIRKEWHKNPNSPRHAKSINPGKSKGKPRK